VIDKNIIRKRGRHERLKLEDETERAIDYHKAMARVEDAKKARTTR